MGEWRRVNWVKQGLGTRSDTEIARKLGVTRQRVQRAREERGIPVSPSTKMYHHKGVEWDIEPLGDVPDKQLATKHGVTVVTVVLARKRRGIKSYTERHGSTKDKADLPGQKGRQGHDVNWDEQPLGKTSDRKIAKDLSLSPGVVRRARIQRGIPVAKTARKYIKKGVDWDNQPLGKVRDDELAEKLGVQPNTVYIARRKRGIKLDDGLLKRNRVDWDSVPLGKEPDKLIAFTNGCTVSAVAYARNARGIPPCRPKCQTWSND